MSAYDHIRSAPPGTVIRPSEVPFPESEVKEGAIRACADGLIEFVFSREDLTEWTALSREAHGDDPARILVGLRRK